MTDAAPPLADVTACRACGYLVAGLPPTGACPECGAAYDRGDLYAFGRRSRWSWWSTALPAASWAVLAATAVRHPRDWADLVYMSCLGLGVVGFATAMLTRWWGNRPGSARLRLSASGCQLDVEPDPPPLLQQLIAAAFTAIGRRRRGNEQSVWVPGILVPWVRVRHLRLTPARDGRWRVRVEQPGTAPGRRVPVDMTADLTPEQLAAVRAFAGRFTTITG